MRRRTVFKRWVAPVLLICLSVGILIADRTRAQSVTELGLGDKLSTDLRLKVVSARAGERISVIVQPKGKWSSELDSELPNRGANEMQRFQNFRTRVVNIPANAVERLALRNDVA